MQISPPKNRMKKTLLALALILCGLTAAQAEVRYVTDQSRIMMRSGESVQHKILRTLRSGQALELIESNPETGYSKVATEDGQTGYVLTRQLMTTPSARDRLAEVERELRALKEAPEQLASKLALSESKLQKLSADYAQLQETKGRIEQELESIRRTAADSIRMARERTELRKTVAAMTRQLEDLKQENRDLSNEGARNWFLVGAGVVILGILIGLILPRLHIQRRRDTWGSL